MLPARILNARGRSKMLVLGGLRNGAELCWMRLFCNTTWWNESLVFCLSLSMVP
jgi:hypothetical protein